MEKNFCREKRVTKRTQSHPPENEWFQFLRFYLETKCGWREIAIGIIGRSVFGPRYMRRNILNNRTTEFSRCILCNRNILGIIVQDVWTRWKTIWRRQQQRMLDLVKSLSNGSNGFRFTLYDEFIGVRDASMWITHFAGVTARVLGHQIFQYDGPFLRQHTTHTSIDWFVVLRPLDAWLRYS